MERDVTICFRTHRQLRESLEMAAAEDRRSLSSVIENILVETLQARKLMPARERRRFPRQEGSLPALIRMSEFQQARSGVILDLSLAGMKISVPKEAKIEMKEGKEGPCLEVSFAIPQDRSAMTVKCRPEWMSQRNGTVDLGLSFDDCSFTDYKRLQTYLAS